MQRLYTVKELSLHLGLTSHRVHYLILTGVIEKPAYKTSRQILFTEQQLKRLAQIFWVSG
jgi:DNA-binding transcriptional MerR regulator